MSNKFHPPYLTFIIKCYIKSRCSFINILGGGGVKTRPKHWLDIVLWPIIKVIWEPFSKKRSHFWHWIDYSGRLEKTLVIKGVWGEADRTGFWSNLWQTNFGWKNVAIIEPQTENFYRIGFFEPATNKKQLCSCLVSGRIGLLVGPNDVQIFALDEEGEFCEIRLIDRIKKRSIKKLYSCPLL